MLLLPRAALAPASVARCQAGRRTLVVRPMAFVAGEAAPEEPSGAAPAPPAAAAKAKRGRPAGAAAAAAKPAATPKPASPLRSPTAFNLFYKARYPAYKEANPGAKLADTSKALRAEWETLPAETKAPFVEQAAGRKAEVDAIKAQALALKKANAKPLTAFMLYSSRNRAAIKAANPEAKLTQVSSLLGKAWNELPEEQRATYKEQAASELAAWKAKQGAASA